MKIRVSLQVSTVGIKDANIMKRTEKNKNPALFSTFSALSPISKYRRPMRTPMIT